MMGVWKRYGMWMMLVCMITGIGTAGYAADPVKLFTIVQDGKWGYMDEKGAVKIKPIYDQAFDFSEGMAAVTEYPLRGYIDATGKMVIKPKFVWTGPFKEGHAMAVVSPHFYGGNVNYYSRSYALYSIDKAGKYNKRLRLRGGRAGFHDGRLVCGVKNTKVYDVNMKDLPHDILQICTFSDKTAPARREKKGLWGYVDIDLKWIIEPQFATVGEFHEGLAAVSKSGGQWGFIDKTGKTVIQPTFKDALDFSEGLAPVLSGDKWGYADKTGKVTITPTFDYAWPFSEGMARVLVGGKQGFIDKTGKMVVQPQFRPAWDFSMGLARVAVDAKEGYIDKTGKYVWEPTK